MQATLAVTIPFFALVLAGWLAARTHVMPETAIPGLNSFVLYFALPCMLYRFGASLPVRDILAPSVLLLYFACALIMVLGTFALTLSPRVPVRDAAFGALAAAFPNSGFMGVPLLAALLGPASSGPVISTVLVDIIFTSSFAIALSQWHSTAGGGPWRAAGRALRAAALNPLPWAIALGLLSSAHDLALPGPLATIVRMLADAATPVALFTIGAVLWRAGAHVHTRTPPALFLPLAAVKLAVHPLLVWGLGSLAIALGAPLAPGALTVLVLAAALPSASNVSILAERYGADNGRIARVILVSTAVAFVSFTLLATWLGAGS